MTNFNYPASFDVSQINGKNGFPIYYNIYPNNTCINDATITLGDFNSDGIDDFLLEEVIILGQKNGFQAINFSANISGANIIIADGTLILGNPAGDFNGDGIKDILAAGNDMNYYHDILIAYGSPKFPSTVGLSWITPSTAAMINASIFTSQSFNSYDVGDINGDRLSDIFIEVDDSASFNASPSRYFIVFGDKNLPWGFILTDVNGSNGLEFTLNSGNVFVDISKVNDLNNDGFGDVIFSWKDHKFDTHATVLFGSKTFTSPLNINNLMPGESLLLTLNDFTKQQDDDLWSGDDDRNSINNGILSISAEHDVDGDKITDLVIGCSWCPSLAFQFNLNPSGRVYVIKGSEGGYPASLGIKGINETFGYVFEGNFPGEGLGVKIATGDFNGDGIGDIAAADLYSINLILGGNFQHKSVVNFNGQNGVNITGVLNPECSNINYIYGLTFADINGDGYSDLLTAAGDPNNQIGTYGILGGSYIAD